MTTINNRIVMKKAAIILSVFIFLASSCRQVTKKQVENNNVIYEQNDENPVVASEKFDSIFTSSIRPNEKLLSGKIYTDNFEYIGYNDDGNYYFFIVTKDREKITLLDGLIIENKTFPKLNRGDMVEIQWKIDSSWVAGDGDRLEMTEWAINLKKTKDGNVSLFKKKYTKPLKYNYESNYSTSFLDEIYKNVEYYLANSKQDLVKLTINDPNSSLIYSIEEQEKNGKKYYAVGISNEFENHQSIIQWIYLNEDLSEIFEYDLPNDELIKFQ